MHYQAYVLFFSADLQKKSICQTLRCNKYSFKIFILSRYIDFGALFQRVCP